MNTVGLRLAALVVACVAPVSLLAALVVAEAYQQKRALIEQHMVEAAQGVILTLDGVLGDARAALQALATSPHLTTGDLAGFHAQAREVTKLFPGSDVIMADRTGQQLVNTYRKYGEQLPKRNAPDLVRRVFEGGKPVFGDLFFGAVTKRPLVAVDVPVILDGAVIYDLSMTMPAERLGGALDRFALPPRWSGVISDRNDVVAGQIGDGPRVIGQKAPPELGGLGENARKAAVRVSGFDGASSIAVAARSPDSGWKALIFAPTELIDDELRAWLAWSFGAVAALLAVGLALALRVSAGIARSIKRLTEPALALGRGQTAHVAPSGLRETDAVCEALNAASLLMAERAAQRDLAEANLKERTDQLQRQHDSLRALNEIVASAETDVAHLLTAALEAGRRRFGLLMGIVSRVEGRKYTVHCHVAPPEAGLENGMSFELGETYCALTLDADKAVAISHMRTSSYAGHPCYQKFGLECYIGAPLVVRGKRFGTVNFTSPEPAQRPYDDGDKEFIGLLARWIGAAMERHQVMDELARSNAELEQFAYIASHDLREPLRQVSTYITLLERRVDHALDEEARGFFTVVRSGSNRMNQLILDLLDYSTIGRHDRAMTAVCLGRAAGEALAKLAPAIEEASAVIEGVEALPTVGGDHAELARLFIHLISNAVKYREPERALKIALAAERGKSGWWTVSVSDNGIGVAPEYHDRIFLIFQRLHDHQTYEGTGIGLAGAKKIVERLGGRIWVESALGLGSRFIFTLPPPPDGEEAARP